MKHCFCIQVNEKIFLAACALFHCDADDENKLGLLCDAGLYIRDISGIACEDWDILKLNRKLHENSGEGTPHKRPKY